MMKVEAREFLVNYSITHGIRSVKKNATYLAKLLHTNIEDVIKHIPPGVFEDGHRPHDSVYERKLEVQVRQAVRAAFAQKTMGQKSQTARAKAKKPAKRTRTLVKSGDGNSSSDPDPEPEPPRPHLSSPFYIIYKDLPLALPTENFAEQLGCATKTIRNQVSAGLLQRPIRTAVGPRFTHEQLAQALAPQRKPTGTRGRPRIAQTLGKGGVQ